MMGARIHMSKVMNVLLERVCYGILNLYASLCSSMQVTEIKHTGKLGSYDLRLSCRPDKAPEHFHARLVNIYNFQRDPY